MDLSEPSEFHIEWNENKLGATIRCISGPFKSKFPSKKFRFVLNRGFQADGHIGELCQLWQATPNEDDRLLGCISHSNSIDYELKFLAGQGVKLQWGTHNWESNLPEATKRMENVLTVPDGKLRNCWSRVEHWRKGWMELCLDFEPPERIYTVTNRIAIIQPLSKTGMEFQFRTLLRSEWLGLFADTAIWTFFLGYLTQRKKKEHLQSMPSLSSQTAVVDSNHSINLRYYVAGFEQPKSGDIRKHIKFKLQLSKLEENQPLWLFEIRFRGRQKSSNWSDWFSGAQVVDQEFPQVVVNQILMEGIEDNCQVLTVSPMESSNTLSVRWEADGVVTTYPSIPENLDFKKHLPNSWEVKPWMSAVTYQYSWDNDERIQFKINRTLFGPGEFGEAKYHGYETESKEKRLVRLAGVKQLVHEMTMVVALTLGARYCFHQEF